MFLRCSLPLFANHQRVAENICSVRRGDDAPISSIGVSKIRQLCMGIGRSDRPSAIGRVANPEASDTALPLDMRMAQSQIGASFFDQIAGAEVPYIGEVDVPAVTRFAHAFEPASHENDAVPIG